jgi:hypothetical protein
MNATESLRAVVLQVQQHGVQLHGFFKRTQHDEDYQFFVDLAQQHCSSSTWTQNSASAGAAVQQHQVLQHQPALQTWGEAAGAVGSGDTSGGTARELSAVDLDGYELLLSQGIGVFAAGISHQQYIDLTAAMATDRESL